MTIAVRRLFNHNWSVVWATTYTCGVVEFDEYFLGQLRPDDLNVTILADFGALTETWSAMKEMSGPSRLRRVNRAYLLRPVAWYGTRFIPRPTCSGMKTSACCSSGRAVITSRRGHLWDAFTSA